MVWVSSPAFDDHRTSPEWSHHCARRSAHRRVETQRPTRASIAKMRKAIAIESWSCVAWSLSDFVVATLRRCDGVMSDVICVYLCDLWVAASVRCSYPASGFAIRYAVTSPASSTSYNQPMTKQDTFTGGCLCGAVRFEVAAPTKWCAHCHCSLCRRAHGAAFVTWFGVPNEQFHWTLGEERVCWYPSTPEARPVPTPPLPAAHRLPRTRSAHRR